MATTTPSAGSSHDEEHNNTESPKSLVIGWGPASYCQYQGYWLPEKALKSLKLFQRHFEAHNSDIILATVPRSGTIWLKSLVFAIVNRTRYTFSQHPLLTNAPHQLVPFLEFMVYGNETIPDLTKLEPPRIFGTHVHYPLLPNSIKDSDCKIVYLCRNPRDNFISLWQFMNKVPNAKPLSLEEAFELYCRGVSLSGPFWDHVLGFWKASLENPKKVLFLQYEEMKKDTTCLVKKLAEFLGCPFTQEEESQGIIDGIVKLCSFDHLKKLDVNNQMTPRYFSRMSSRKILLRKGEVGDWMNYFTPSMISQLDRIIKEKLHGSGLEFHYSLG
ncbi:hydroxyjasmonate sulfotransferase [Ranunculus cassubicifolius]